jgi:hypothetical protein
MRPALLIPATGFLLSGAALFAMPVEVHSFPPGIPVTCGAAYRLVSGEWLHTEPEGDIDFSGEVRSEWEHECRGKAAPRVATGTVLSIVGAILMVTARARRVAERKKVA